MGIEIEEGEQLSQAVPWWRPREERGHQSASKARESGGLPHSLWSSSLLTENATNLSRIVGRNWIVCRRSHNSSNGPRSHEYKRNIPSKKPGFACIRCRSATRLDPNTADCHPDAHPFRHHDRRQNHRSDGRSVAPGGKQAIRATRPLSPTTVAETDYPL